MANAAHIDPIFKEKLKLTIEHTPFGIAATFLTSTLLALLLWKVSEQKNILIWVSCVATLSVLRYAHILYYKRSTDDLIYCKTWRLLFYTSFALSGSLWGLSIVFLAPMNNLPIMGANVLWVCAIIAGAIGSYSFLKRVFIAFSVSACIPGVIYLVSTGDSLKISIAAGMLVACLYMILSSTKLNQIIDKNIKSTMDEIHKSKKISAQRNILHSIAEAAEFLLEDSWEISTYQFLERLGININVSRIQIFENTVSELNDVIIPNPRFHWFSEEAPEYKYDENVAISYHELKLERWQNLLSKGESIHGDIDSFSEDEQEFLHAISIKSLFIIPIFVGNNWWGFISFDECRRKRTWTDEEINALKTAAAVIGAAIKRTWAEDKLSYHASHDSLTKLHNRRAFEVELNRLIQTCIQDRVSHVLCYIDLDRFKIVNDTCGHNAGDLLLCQISEVMKNSVRKNDFLARIGGDEFAILLQNISLDEARAAVKTLQSSIEKFSFHYEENSFRVGVSIGIVPINLKCTDADKILQAADNACRAVKQSNTGQIRIYNIDDTEINHQKSSSHSYLHINKALENDEFTLLFQPITKTNETQNEWKHFEVLIRMKSDNNTLMSPKRFLPTAERYNLINKIDRWVFKACIKKLEKHKILYDHVNTLSINISGATLCEPNFRKYVTDIFNKYKVPANKICFEITETVAVSNLIEANNFISCLRNLGCKFALDDFGTGFSSFDNLKNLDVDYVKIDGSFIKEITNNPIDYEMVRSLNKVSKLMKIETIAEFVEDEKTLDTLKDIGITFVQGYAISKPLQLQDLLDPNHRNIDVNKKFVA